MPIVIGLGTDAEWNDPLNLYGGNAPGLSPTNESLNAPKPVETKPSFLANMDERDRTDLVNTVLAEAAGEGDEGMAGVAAVIKNRSGIRGLSPAEVVRQPKQFTGYEAPGAEVAKSFNDPNARANAERIIDGVFNGEIPDPTVGPDGKGADHYHADSVNPDWAGKMPATAKIGRHQYYNSKGEPQAQVQVQASAFVPEQDPLGLYGPKGQFRDLLKGEEKSSAPNPEAKGLARLVREPEEKHNSGGGKLNFVHAGQEKIAPQFEAILTDTSKAMGKDFTINSGYRAPTHKVEAAKPGGPGEHADGTASDISMKGMSEPERAQLVRELYSRGARRFITYKNSPDMLHVDLKDQTGKGTPWFMFDKSNRNLPNAPAWFQDVAANPGENSVAPTVAAGKGIVVDENYAPSDGLGLYAGSVNPMEAEAKALAQAKAASDAEEAKRLENERLTADVNANNATVDQALAKSNGRLAAVSETEAADWQKKWDEENRSGSTFGDLMRRWGTGAANTSQSMTNLNTLLINKLPGGETINSTLDSIDRWLGGGKTIAEKRAEGIEKQSATLTPEGEAARDKKWWDDENKTLGPAWTDPRSYLGAIAESGPATVASMLPSGILARGAFLSSVASGATTQAAAATAARTATIAGGITEGLLGGADAAQSVKQRISELPREQLLASDAVKQLIDTGMSEQQAIDSISEDAQTQALLTAGVVTGSFGGMGDRALAKIIAEGVEGGIARRIGVGAAKGMVGEGIFEEAPQSAGQTIAENAAIQRVNPDQEITEGLGEAVASGVATGGAMGGGMGAAGGAARPSHSAGTATPVAPEPDNRGPLRRAADHAEQRNAARAAAQPAQVPQDGRPRPTATVRVDAEGVEPFMGTVESYEGDEAVVVDSGSGEVYQVPLANITEIAPPIGDYRYPEKSIDAMPELSGDPAMEPLAPMSAQVKSEVPPRSEDKPATELRPIRPQPGQRVIVDTPEAGRFAARIERYENDGDEAIVIDDSGKPFQVPTTAMNVSSLTPAQIEAQELERNPPIEREIGDAGPNSRKIGKSTVLLPDENHAALYDLAREQAIAKRLGGTSQVDMGSVLPTERKRLADAFRIKVEDLASMADDYRYRAERAARESKSTLPVKLHSVNERILKQRQSAKAKDAAELPIQSSDADATWWDVDLTDQARKGILQQAGIQRSEKSMWKVLTPALKKKLVDVRDAQSAANETVETLAGRFKTAKGSSYDIHPDGTTTRTKALRDQPGHEGDSGKKARTARTVYVDTNAGALSAAGLTLTDPKKGARVAIRDGKATLVTWNGKENGWGASPESRGITIHDTPAVGRYPLELWDQVEDVPGYTAYSRMHAGNAIVEYDGNSDRAANEAATSPTNDLPEPSQAQKEAGNYKVGRLKLGGLDISVENPAGSERKGKSQSGKEWSVKMKSHYGYILGTVGKDKDHIDIFVRPGTETLDDAAPVFVVDQRDPARGRFDEHKVMAGFDNEAEAKAAYLENYTAGWKGLGDISQTTMGEFKNWLKSGKTSEPFAPKWFSSQEKADAYVVRNKMGQTHDVVQRGKRFEVQERTKAQAAKERTNPNTPDWGKHPWDEIWGSDAEVISDALSRIASTNGGDTPISDAVKAGATNKELLELIEARWGEGGAGGRRYMIETRKGPTVAITLEKDNGNERVVLKGKELADAIRSEFVVSLEDMKREHEAREKGRSADIERPAKAKPARSGQRRKLYRGASKEEIDALRNGSFAFRPGQTGIMFTSDRETASYFGNANKGEAVAVTIPADAKAINRGQIRESTPEWYALRDEAFKDLEPGADAEGAIRNEALRQGYEIVMYKSGNGEYDVVEVLDPSIIDVSQEPKAATAPKPTPKVSQNKIFTEDAAAKARELLRKKFSGNTLNSGIDPELLQAGLTLAGYHIEKGARTFAAYASAMLADLGEGSRPYLKSWYMGVKYDPRASAFDGMSSAADVEATDVNALNGAPNEPEQLDRAGASALERVPAEPVQGTESRRDAGRGAEERGGADISGSEPARGGRVQAGRSVADGQGELSVAPARGNRAASERPDVARSDEGRSSRTENSRDRVEEGSFGPILRGYEGKWREAALELERRQTGDAIGALSHPDVGPIDLVWGTEGTDQNNGSGLAKLIAWHPEVLSDLQGFLDRLKVVESRSTSRRIQLADESGNAGVRLDFDGAAKTWLLTAYETGKRRTEKSSRRLSDLWGGRETAPSSPRVENIASALKDVQSAATPAQQRQTDYVITDEDALGEGGQKAKFKSNIAAIELVKKLEEERRPATRDEQSVLAKWVGWGGLRTAFPREDGSVAKGWEREADQLKDLLTKEEYSAAESSTRNAHYTAPNIVNAAWIIAQRLGFQGGQILEPSVGAGNFLGLMPGELRSASRVSGVELDRITGLIAKNLYPNANIQAPMGFEKLSLPNDYFDLAIGNPPFGSERLYDKERSHLNKLSIHNFFFAKAIETLRPGGVLAMVVTNRFLDGQSAAARNLIHAKADFIGAIRLPNNAFLKNAGTEVTTDIVLLQRREAGQAPKSSEWLEVKDYRGKDGNVVPLNAYFAKNPEMMLGDFGAYGTMYGPDEPALVARGGQDTPAELAKAIETLPQNIMGEPVAARVTETVTVPETVNDVQVGTMFAAPDGTIHVREQDHIGEARSKAVTFPNDTAKERVSGMVRVRDAFARLRRAQISDTAKPEQVENLRRRLNTFYDASVNKHGPINSDANKRLFRDDPTWPQISALEQKFDKGLSAAVAKKTGEKARPATAEKAAIFTRRTQQPYQRPTSAATAKDALATVLNDYGRINLEAMSRLYGKSTEAIVDELGPLVYRTPTGSYETADQYLSGNVKQKLAEAERASAQDPEFRRNVNALRDVIPADIEAIDIDVKPGAPWLPAKHVEDFVSHITQASIAPRAFYSAANAKWDLTVPQVTPAAQTQWGTDRAAVGTVLSAVMNGQSITIHDRTSDGKSVVNQAATDAANEKAERVKAEWRKWLWQDDARRDQLSRLYNDTFNTDVMQQFDGSHLTLPGKVSDDIIDLRPSQKNFIWRTLQSGTALADHTVGAGKTFAAIASIMEKRRTGQARKPMLVVPNHLVGQWAADFVRLYPGAKVLAATKQDFEKDRRKRLFARIATGDWDAVIVAHSSFGRIGIDPNYEAQFIQQQMDDLEASMAEVRRETGQKSRNVAQLTKWRDGLKTKMERLLDSGRKDDGLTFDELGVDALYVDEAHEFKNLAYSTSMQRVAGLGNMAGSQKAADLYMKSRFVLEKTGNNNLVFLSGTPLSNTMAEMFTVQRYLDEKALRAMGVAHFDAWARVFGEVVTDWELSPSGQYKLNSRFAKFVNVPELMQRYRSFADVITNDDIIAQLAAQGKKFPLPKVKGGKPTNVVVERSPDQASFIGEGKSDDNGNLEFPRGSLVWRAENLPKKAEKGQDNMLKVMSDARKAALDMRLIDPSYGDYRKSKVHRAANEMKRIYDAWSDQRGTQLVFIDLSTPKKAQAAEAARFRDLMERADNGDEAAIEALDKVSPDDLLALESTFSVYDDLKQKLIDRGIPESEIAFIHDANTEAQKEELFGKVRSGRIRLLFGSTAKMGAGTNVQNRLVALHHLDAPWRPSDLEQRDGRGIRQGNELYGEDPDGFEIEILRYATKNTLDARQWQTIEAKARFIQQVRKGDMKTREIEDIAGEAANAAEMKAAASGNPLILEEMDTRRKLRQLEGQSVEHDREQHRIKAKIKSLTEEAAAIEKALPLVQSDAAMAAAAPAEFAGTIGGETFDKRKEFGAAIVAAMRKELIDKEGVRDLGEYAGFKIGIDPMGYGRAFHVTIRGKKEYSIPVDDASDVDAAGLATRIANTVKRIANQPEFDQSRAAEIKSQTPALERQIGEWAGAQELADTSARHNRLLDSLKPKPKSATPVAAVANADEFDAPTENKRPDPVVVGTANDLQTVGIPKAPAGKAIFKWAKDTVLRFGKNGHEYLMAVDDDGSVIEFGTAKKKAATGINNKLLGAFMNPDRRVVVLHNHPSNGPLSVTDIAMLAMPGLHSVWAFGANGAEMRGSLTPDAERAVSSASSPDALVAEWRRDMTDAHEAVDAFLRPLVERGTLDIAEGNSAYLYAPSIIAQKAGLIDISSNTNYDVSAIEGLDAKLDKLAVALKGLISDGTAGDNQRVSRRPARDVRHVAEVEGLASLGQPVVSARSGTTGLSETSSPDYQGKERGAEKRSSNGKRVTKDRIVEDLRGKLTDIQPALLKTIPLNYFSELARSNMTAVGDYLRVKRLMDAFRGTKHAEADAVAQDWLKYTRLGFAGKDKAKAQALADLMHDATLAGVDPSKTDEETKAKPGYDALRKRYLAMPPKGRELFNDVSVAYGKQADELDEILLDNVRKAQEIAQRNAEDRYKRTMQKIKDARLSGLDKKNAEEDATSAYKAETTKSRWAAKARLTKMRIAFENSRVEAPYFPLGRFGRYFVTVRDIDGAVLSFSKHETAAERDRMAREMRQDYPAGKVEVGVMEAGGDMRKAMDPRIVAEIEEILGGSNVGGDVMDQIWQRYLESMPDLSARKRFIHRKGTAGYSKDALRVFSSHMFHAAHQMARLKYGLELQELVNKTADQAKEADDQTRAMTLANELSNRHNWVMNPTGSKVAQTMTSTAFVWYLAASPGAALVNMTQTVMLGLPVLSAKFGGFGKAASALGKASADSLAGKGTVVSDRLTGDEKKAMDAFYESGLIDRTQSHDLAGVGETGVEYTPLRAKVMEKISWAFHRAEVWNREVTALAAYRMARDSGQSTSDAIDTAHDLTWKTHFDYSNSSRPAVLQNDFAKVALVFRQHNINMLYRVIRDIHQSTKGETAQARKEARYQLAGVLGMMTAMAGVTGTMGFSLAMMMAGMIFGDDDDPMAFEDQFKADVVDILGPQLGGILLNGAPGHYLGIDLSARIGMPDLWFRSPTRELQGKDEYQYWLAQSLGATVSLGEQLYTGFRVITDDGDVARGIEMMAPKAVRDLMKAYRYSQDGLTTIGKDQILAKDQIDATDIAAQALGFTPAKVSETWERNTALKNAETTVKRKRQRLINKWAMATMAGDKDTAAEALDGIKKFNSVRIHAAFPIKSETLKRSIQTRTKNAAKREDGVLIGNKALGTQLREKMAEPIYR
ncbi:N12 class adenine-specific DNA methylase [Rhizobium skierniewicense]|uniref:N12 class adenine-specific DNA methylase n=1 Tax=Rhizobium skierniewicense TaxID=984260 RepID=A0A7W6G2G3_9HYPH|nr:PLxRFG domain-containing protein [Rhizobium skierniewicense]MBB3947058.1 N12 class adenine-specific DNA methylase [Rhizobium skierniewicense]